MKERLTNLDAFRGLAALSVAWFHFTSADPGFPAIPFLKQSGAYGFLGVEIFFAISGFIIPYSLFKSRYELTSHAGSFLTKRLIRLHPPYLASIIVALVPWYLQTLLPGFSGYAFSIGPKDLAAHIGLVTGFLNMTWIQTVYWSLAIEFQYYIAAALIFPLMVHTDRRIRLSSTVLFAFTVLIPLDGRFLFEWTPLFAFGMISFQLYTGLIDRREFFGLFAVVTVLGLIGSGYQGTLVALFSALGFTFIRGQAPRVLTFLGTISYSIYLIHAPVGSKINRIGIHFLQDSPLVALIPFFSLAASIACAYVFFRLVELPAQRWSSKIRFEKTQPSYAV